MLLSVDSLSHNMSVQKSTNSYIILVTYTRLSPQTKDKMVMQKPLERLDYLHITQPLDKIIDATQTSTFHTSYNTLLMKAPSN